MHWITGALGASCMVPENTLVGTMVGTRYQRRDTLLHWAATLSDTVRSRRLSFFGHLHLADDWQDHHRALQACIMDPPGDWRRRAGRPRQSWLRTVEADLRPMNLGL